jgi:hypothetical protein
MVGYIARGCIDTIQIPQGYDRQIITRKPPSKKEREKEKKKKKKKSV